MSNPGTNSKLSQLPTPVADVGSLASFCQSAKQAIDSLAGFRGGTLDRAVTFHDLVRLELADASTIESDNGRSDFATNTALNDEISSTSTTTGSLQSQIDAYSSVVHTWTAKQTYSFSDGAEALFLKGASKAIRLYAEAGDYVIEGRDNTDSTYQPLILGGSSVSLSLSGAVKVSLTTAGWVANFNAASAPAAGTASSIQLNGADSIKSTFQLNSFGVNSQISLLRANNTGASPAVVASSDVIAEVDIGGYDGSAYRGARGILRWRAAGAWSTTALGTSLEVLNTTNGTTTQNVVATFGDGVYLGSPTGTDKGIGTLNTTGLYINGTGLQTVATHGTASGGSSSVSATGTMSGVSLSFTPTRSGVVRITISIQARHATAGGSVNCQIYTGTGSAPALNAALTGTAQGTIMGAQSSTAANKIAIPVLVAHVTATVGTAIWISYSIDNGGAGTATVDASVIEAFEL